MAQFEEIPEEERLKFRQKAYDKLQNIIPVQKEKQGIERQQIERQGMSQIGQGLREGGSAGQSRIGKALDQTGLEVAGKLGAQQKETDETAYTGAQMKEEIEASRQGNKLSQFKKQNEQMEEALSRAITQRAFDLGMSSKELAFHTNAKVSDLGFEKLKKDFEDGMVNRQELNTVKDNLEREAKKLETAVKEMMNELRWQTEEAAKNREFDRLRELTKKIQDMQKKTLEAKARAASIGAIISGATKVGGSMILGDTTMTPELGNFIDATGSIAGGASY